MNKIEKQKEQYKLLCDRIFNFEIKQEEIILYLNEFFSPLDVATKRVFLKLFIKEYKSSREKLKSSLYEKMTASLDNENFMAYPEKKQETSFFHFEGKKIECYAPSIENTSMSNPLSKILIIEEPYEDFAVSAFRYLTCSNFEPHKQALENWIKSRIEVFFNIKLMYSHLVTLDLTEDHNEYPYNGVFTISLQNVLIEHPIKFKGRENSHTNSLISFVKKLQPLAYELSYKYIDEFLYYQKDADKQKILWASTSIEFVDHIVDLVNDELIKIPNGRAGLNYTKLAKLYLSLYEVKSERKGFLTEEYLRKQLSKYLA